MLGDSELVKFKNHLFLPIFSEAVHSDAHDETNTALNPRSTSSEYDTLQVSHLRLMISALSCMLVKSVIALPYIKPWPPSIKVLSHDIDNVFCVVTYLGLSVWESAEKRDAPVRDGAEGSWDEMPTPTMTSGLSISYLLLSQSYVVKGSYYQC